MCQRRTEGRSSVAHGGNGHIGQPHQQVPCPHLAFTPPFWRKPRGCEGTRALKAETVHCLTAALWSKSGVAHGDPSAQDSIRGGSVAYLHITRTVTWDQAGEGGTHAARGLGVCVGRGFHSLPECSLGVARFLLSFSPMLDSVFLILLTVHQNL